MRKRKKQQPEGQSKAEVKGNGNSKDNHVDHMRSDLGIGHPWNNRAGDREPYQEQEEEG